MSFLIYYKYGKGSIVGEFGNHAVDMDIEEKQFGFWTPEREQKNNTERQAGSLLSNKIIQKGVYKKYDDCEKALLFLVYEKSPTSGKSEKKFNVPCHIAYEEFIRVPPLDVHCKKTFKYIEQKYKINVISDYCL